MSNIIELIWNCLRSMLKDAVGVTMMRSVSLVWPTHTFDISPVHPGNYILNCIKQLKFHYGTFALDSVLPFRNAKPRRPRVGHCEDKHKTCIL